MNAARDRADLGIRLLDGYAVSQPRDGAVIMRSAAGIFALEYRREPTSRRLRSETGNRFGKNADDRVDGVIDLSGAAAESPKTIPDIASSIRS